MFKTLPHPNLTASAARKDKLRDPGFGKVFTDYMATMRFTAGKGWHDARIGPRVPFQIDPAAGVLHYAQEIFEGMKAYRSGNGIALFRPLENAARFAQSAERLAMPILPDNLFLDAVESLVRAEDDWIPEQEGASLYLRPFMFATEAFLGVRAATEYIFCVIASPAGAYFKGGAKPIKLWVSDDYTRAAAGGTGAAKCGGNYAASLVAQQQAVAKGCDQVVFLDAAERRWVEELGGMNMFFVFDDDTLRTPPLGTILPGITRASILTLAAEQGLKVEEAPYDIDSWKADAASGRLKEAFACGTAAVVAAVGEIRWTGGEQLIGGGFEGPITAALRDELTGIQRGSRDDVHGWRHTIAI